MQKSRPNFFAKACFIMFRKLPQILQKQNDLRRHRDFPFFRQLGTNEQPKRIHLNPISLQVFARLPFKGHRQPFRPFAQRLWQRRQGFLHCRQSQRANYLPIQIHNAIVSSSSPRGNHHAPCFSLALERLQLIVCLIYKFMLANKPLFIFAILAIHLAFAPSVLAQQVPVVETNLPNGMKLLLVERHDDPSIAGGWVTHVGSANERPGITGIAHLFEHMMFKGTTTIGTTDYKQDQKILAAQEKIRDAMRAEESKMRAAWRLGAVDDWQKPENWTPRYRELQKQFNDLVLAERKVLVKNELWKIYQANGGAGMNAFTMDDMTAFFVSVPANKLELWMWLESERIFHPVFREFYAERDVVFEERRMRYDSTPLGPAEQTFSAMFWQSLPYSWPTIGWPSDISSISKPQADAFHATYYCPQNITLILVGDFDPKQVTALAAKYFGRIPRAKTDPPDLVTTEMKQPAEKRMNAEVAANPQVDIMWHTVPFAHKDSYPLQILAQILATHTGRLYKGLVLGNGVATDVSASQNSQKWAGWFDISGEAADGHAPEEVEKAIYAEIEKLKSDPVPADELQKVKNNFAADQFRDLKSNMSILQSLVWNDGEGDWREINAAQPKLEAVTAAEVMRVANEYLIKDNRAVAIFTRKPETAATESK